MKWYQHIYKFANAGAIFWIAFVLLFAANEYRLQRHTASNLAHLQTGMCASFKQGQKNTRATKRSLIIAAQHALTREQADVQSGASKANIKADKQSVAQYLKVANEIVVAKSFPGC